MPETVTIQLFGDLRASGKDMVAARFAPSRPGALLVWLALHPRRAANRQQLACELWPELDTISARNNLRQSLAALRNELKNAGMDADHLIDSDRDSIRLKPGSYATDVSTFENSLEAAGRALDNTERIARLVEAVEQVRGQLVPGFDDHWIVGERERFTRRMVGALHQLAVAYEQLGDLDNASEYGLRAVKTDPLNEESTLLLMRCYARAGKQALAVRQFQELERLLKTHLDVAPSAEASAFVTNLRNAATSNGRLHTTDPSEPQTVLPVTVSNGHASNGAPVVAYAPGFETGAGRPASAFSSRERFFWVALTVGLLAWHLLSILSPKPVPAATADKSALSAEEAKAVLSTITAPKTPLSAMSLVFSSDRHGPFHLFRMNADGSNVIPLTNTAANDFHPTVSSDGKQIAFSRETKGHLDLWVMNADGHNQHRLTSDVDKNDCPAWSPDGRFIAFESQRDGVYQIYAMPREGGKAMRVTHSNNASRVACWSPDSLQIVFQEGVANNTVISRIDVDGKNYKQLTTPEGSSVDSHPAWAPMGDHIAFISSRNARSGDYNVYVMNRDGHNLLRVTDNHGDAQFPVWSPDGAWIVFTSYCTGDSELYAVHPGDAYPKRLTFCIGQDSQAAWFPQPSPPPSNALH